MKRFSIPENFKADFSQRYKDMMKTGTVMRCKLIFTN